MLSAEASMKKMIFGATALAGVVAFGSPGWSAPEPLSLDEAVTIALAADDPTVVRFEERAAAFDEQAIADSQLSDPKLRFRFNNFPVNSFRLGQEPMTQIQLGLQQAFPRGKTLSLTRKRREAQARAERAKERLQERNIVLDTRTTWLELFYWLGARQKVADSRQAVSELLKVATAIFATGRQTSQDVQRAELELSLLDDRLVNVDRRIEMARADLSRLVGEAPARRPLTPSLPVLQMPPAKLALRDALVRHPMVAVDDAMIEARKRDIDIAGEQYKPGWAVDANYGLRSAGRADFATLGVAIDLPFFTGKRQDRTLAAAKRNHQASRLDRDARLLELNKSLERTYADWRRLGERVTLYKKVVINRASGTTQAALGAYRSGVSDFAELIRSRLAELDADLTLLRLQVNRAQAQARLLYLNGE
jgi:outer membrane protein TolC